MNQNQPTKYDEIVNWFKNHPLFCIIIFVGALIILSGQLSRSVSDIRSLFMKERNASHEMQEKKQPSQWSKQLQSYGGNLPGNVHIFPGTNFAVIDKQEALFFYQTMNLKDDTDLDKLRKSIVEKLKYLTPIHSKDKTFHIIPDILLEDMGTLYRGVKEHAEATP